jgi:hypothetical protein
MKQKIKKFSIHTAKCEEKYMLPDGRIFEFRYVSDPAYGFIFVIFEGERDAYLTKDNYKGAILTK